MEIKIVPARQLSKINVHGSAKSVPTRESLWLDTLEIPEGIADVLKIKVNSTLLQTRPLATPGAKKVTVRDLTSFVTVRAGERFLLSCLRTYRKRK